jgi:hypothetical protein
VRKLSSRFVDLELGVTFSADAWEKAVASTGTQAA